MDINVNDFLVTKDPLKSFAHWYIKEVIRKKILHVETIYNNITSVGGCMGVILFRKYPFQVQLFLCNGCSGGRKSPEHTHPDVDAYELYFGGDLCFSKNGKVTFKSVKDEDNDISPMWGWFLRVNSDDKHEAIIGEKGTSFLSIQYWKNNIPISSIEKNWNGDKFGEDHIF